MVSNDSQALKSHQVQTETLLLRLKNLLENISLKFPFKVILSSLPGQFDVSSVKMVNFKLDDCPW